jgi:hypothetical protein
VRSAGWTSTALGFGGAALYLALATPGITAQGLQYDEVHQATAAFAFARPVPGASGPQALFGLPALNMPYSGAIKSGLYGTWMRLTGRSFGVRSWRVFGCLLAAAGIAVAVASFAREVSPVAAILLAVLLATDGTVLLATRHDWGPAALALALRLALVAAWLRAWGRDRVAGGQAFLVGCLLGVALFEKVTAVVLLVPLAAAIALDWPRWRTRALGWAALGAAVGSVLLIVLNVRSWAETRSFVSLSAFVSPAERPPLGEFLHTYFGLGLGSELREWMLGDGTPDWARRAEPAFLALSSLALVAAAVAAPRPSRAVRAAGVFAVLHVLVGLVVLLLPAPTWVHHWVIGTPFQYAGQALGAAALATKEPPSGASRRILAWGFAPIVLSLLVLRIPGIVSLERALDAGHASLAWDPSYTRFASFVARQPAGTALVAAEWGLANQVVCMSGDRVPVTEPFWDYRGQADLRRAVEKWPRFYLAALRPNLEQPGQARRLLEDARALDGYREVPVEDEVASLPAVQAWKFERRDAR